VGLTSAGGIYADSTSTLDLDSSTLSGNEAATDGGAIQTYAVTTLTDTSITTGDATYGGGIWFYGGYGGSLNGDGLSVTSCSAATGGGIYALYGTVDLVDSELTDNDARSGGAIYAYDNDYTDSDLTLTTTTVHRNTADDGGGIYVAYLSAVTSDNSDWGEGADDNEEGDVLLYYVDTYDYGDGASFTCDYTSGECSE
jgi:hypothetical protein